MGFDFSKVEIPAHVSSENWFNWKWQIRNSLQTRSDYEKYLDLNEDEKKAFAIGTNFAVQTTPYYIQLARTSKSQAIRKMITPHFNESLKGRQAMKDPLGEVHHSPLKHLIHRYPDRVVFLVTDICPIYCRYCTRKRFTAQTKTFIKTDEYEKSVEYIKNNKGIREVILSGGDPLTLADSMLEKILNDLRQIDQIEIIRIGSRMPAVCPMRISEKLSKMIKKYQPIFIMSHFNHPAELSFESATALHTLANNGIPVFNQMVLLNSINNHPAIVQALSRRLLFLRAYPYYMFQCDPSLGTDHLRTSIENSKQIQKELWGNLSGLAVPRLAMDLPGGGGKVEISPESLIKKKDGSHTFRGWDGITSDYIDPDKTNIQSPSNLTPYLKEWQKISQQSYGNPQMPDKKKPPLQKIVPS